MARSLVDLRAALAAAALAGCGGTNATPANMDPVADLAELAPVLVGQAVRLDASKSKDPDGVITLYRFLVADGTAEVKSAAPAVTHAFVRAGTFDVAATVEDERGGTGRALRSIAVAEPPRAPCRADADCGAGNLCVGGDCRSEPCGPDRPCAAPLACVAGSCVPPATPLPCKIDGDCSGGRTCQSGLCACKAGLLSCGGFCVDAQVSNLHCGACDRTCTGGGYCVTGGCVAAPTCGKDTDCAGAGRVCRAGACACGAAWFSCGTACVDTANDPANCGACGTTCRPGDRCVFGACIARPTCGKDADCGTGGACVTGLCSCQTGRTLCGAACTDTATDALNCGGCGRTCAAGKICAAGACR